MSTASTHSERLTRRDTSLLARRHLFVVLSCANPLESPSRHAIEDRTDVVIGRGAARTAVRSDDGEARVLSLAIADPHVSSAHAKLLHRAGAWVLEDLGSKNGTFVNDARVSSATLEDGDCVRIGNTLLVLRSVATSSCDALDLVAPARPPALATVLPSLARDLDVLARAASAALPMLLTSETGTGKEVLARAIHALSGRRGAFVAVNCGGLPPTLVEGVLFGHRRGAFSGAVADQHGFFRAADGGTLLLDEIGDMPLAAQAAVLRALQDGEVQPIGAARPIHVDTRIVAATHRDPEALLAQGQFREDLLARLAGFTFRLPPLRERREDLGLLVASLLRRLASDPSAITLSPSAGTVLLRHDWPRNVRELEKCLAHGISLSTGGRIELEHLPVTVRRGGAVETAGEDVREKLARLLHESGGNITFAAEAMRTSRSQVHRWLKRFGIQPSIYRR